MEVESEVCEGLILDYRPGHQRNNLSQAQEKTWERTKWSNLFAIFNSFQVDSP